MLQIFCKLLLKYNYLIRAHIVGSALFPCPTPICTYNSLQSSLSIDASESVKVVLNQLVCYLLQMPILLQRFQHPLRVL